MTQIADNWFFQEDVISRLSNTSRLSTEWIAIEERRDSYVEHFFAILVPIRRSRARITLSKVSWGEDFDYSNGRVSRTLLGKRQFLSLKFRRFFDLSFNGADYSADGKVVVKREKIEGDAGRTDVILARLDFVTQFLSKSNQEPLWCIRSQRYSERSLCEFGLEAKNGYVKGATFHFYSQLCLNQNEDRLRMASLSEIFGKCLLSL